MNKASKTAVVRSKPVKKASAAAVKKPVLSSAFKSVKKPVGLLPEEIRLRGVPLAEIEVLAAAAVRRIKASKKLSAARKASRLVDVADSLELARKRGALSYSGASMLKTIHRPPSMRACDVRRACKI